MSEGIYIVKRGEIYEVIFQDDSGISILSRSKTIKNAKRRAKHFINKLDKGELLKEDASVWKLGKVV